MALKDEIEQFKLKNRDTLRFTFKDGSTFQGTGKYTLHYWIDKTYAEAVREYQTKKTQHLVALIKALL